MPSDVARQWFVPGDGIDRHVIVTDIQRYLGNDATVRPGQGTGENDGVMGYWIKAYRNLTTAMIADLRADSARWRQEQRKGAVTREYVGSNTYHNSQAARVPRSREGDSPAVEAPYGSSVTGARERMPVDRMTIDSRMPGADRMATERIPVGRMPADRMPLDRMDDRMQIDPPSGPPQDRRYQTDRNGYPPEQRYGADARGFPDTRPGYPPQEQAPYGRAPVTSSYTQDSVYARSNAYPPPVNDGAPPGYVRQGNYYVPVSSAEQPMRPDPSMYGGSHPYGQPLQPQRIESARDPRDPRDLQRDPRDQRDQRDPRDPRDPRYAQDYPQDPRYAYPSPAATTASLPRSERDAVASPQQPSPYGSAPSQYDQYGGVRPAQQFPPPPGQPGPMTQRNGSQPTRDPTYGRERPTPTTTDSGRNTRRRL